MGPGDNIVDLTDRNADAHRQVLERLVKTQEAALRRFVRQRVGHDQETEDIVQEVFSRLARLGDLHRRLRLGKSDARSYLFTMANNLMVDQERSRARHREYERQHWLESESQLSESPESQLSSQRELELVKAAIMNMRPPWRRAFVLNRLHHMTYRQVAEHMGVSLKQVENYMMRALVRIRDLEESIERNREGQ